MQQNRKNVCGLCGSRRVMCVCVCTQVKLHKIQNIFEYRDDTHTRADYESIAVQWHLYNPTEKPHQTVSACVTHTHTVTHTHSYTHIPSYTRLWHGHRREACEPRFLCPCARVPCVFLCVYARVPMCMCVSVYVSVCVYVCVCVSFSLSLGYSHMRHSCVHAPVYLASSCVVCVCADVCVCVCHRAGHPRHACRHMGVRLHRFAGRGEGGVVWRLCLAE